MRRFGFLFLLVSAGVACATNNGPSIPDPTYDAPTVDASNNTDPGGGGGGQGDGSVDPKKDASSDVKQETAPDVTEAGPAFDVVINEIFVDNAFLGDGAEYVELRGTPGVSVADLKLRLIANDGSVLAEIDAAKGPGDVIQANGTWCVGGSQTFKLGVADHVDNEVSLALWGLDNERGAVQLVKGAAKTLVDVVGYDTQVPGTAAPAPPSAPASTVENKVATVPSVAKKAFGRKAGAADTNDNSADFCKMTPTPGKTPQAACDP